ncbi:LysR family transcriptional regulator [Caballeronia arvi]|uniref:LysR family transcriptional regulator n=1 Tax=Caballeronia arvi TaxID=1777135 RepID=A0A158GEV7_9BURK|nr:LysR family transcriptional regulator [Caballeronia arvi]SAL30552.1 LysR family transcriptional regulator [Caballeronia arvi]
MDNRELLNLAYLRAFRLVAQTGSATRAAAALFRAQSAVTRSLQELEASVGETLLERRPSGMLPTPAGRAVLLRCQRIFGELEELAQWCATRQSRRRTAAGGTLPAFLLNTRRLQLFSALARHRHMPSAAQTLGLSQPAVSSAIRIMETGAGMQLFYRSPRGLLLTSEGETFVLHVRRALNELRHIPDDLAALRGTIQGYVTVGSLPLGRTLILPGAIARVAAQYPGVRIVTDESAYETLVAGLRAGDIDFVLGALRHNDASSGLVNERLMSEDIVVIAGRGHPLANVSGLTLKDLISAQWILPRSHAPARGMFEAQFKRWKLKPPMPTVETADLAVIRGLLTHTDMLAAVSAQQLHYECESGQLVVMDVPLQNTRREIGLTMRAGSTPSPAARALIDAIRLTVDQLGHEMRRESAGAVKAAVS